MNASDVMTRDTATLNTDASLGEAIGVMLGRGISGLPIVDQHGNLVGVLTEGDLLRRVEVGTSERRVFAWWDILRSTGLSAEEYVRTHSRTVGDLMTRDPATITEGTPLEEVVELMERKRIKRLPVVRDGKVVGIVSRADLLRAVGVKLGAMAEAGGDPAIHGRLLAELERQTWFSARNVSVGVKDGVVTLEGTISDEPTRDALRVAAQNAAGTGRVRDKLVLRETGAGMVSIGL